MYIFTLGSFKYVENLGFNAWVAYIKYQQQAFFRISNMFLNHFPYIILLMHP